ncbi:MAG: hypothetical protein AB2L09_08390 [Coriobacteriia bacterium]
MPDAVTVTPAMKRAALNRTVLSGAHWFWWIAGLSALNSISWWLQMNWTFFVGLGITQFIDGIGWALGSWAVYVALALDLLVLVGFIVIGQLAPKYRSAFIIGLVLYFLDAILVLRYQDYGAAAFHVLVIFFIYRGFAAARQLAAEPIAEAVGETASVDGGPDERIDMSSGLLLSESLQPSDAVIPKKASFVLGIVALVFGGAMLVITLMLIVLMYATMGISGALAIGAIGFGVTGCCGWVGFRALRPARESA